jgi:hypothetical protein
VNSDNIGTFYKFANKKLLSKNGVGALRSRQDGGLSVSDEDRANTLNSYFGSVCEEDDGSMPTITCALPDSAHINDIDFSPLKVLAAMRKCKKNSKSSGPDGLPPLLFKKVSTALAGPLSLLFTFFMSTGCIPKAWTHAIVTPIKVKKLTL